MAKKKPLSTRTKARLRHIRRDPLGRLGQELNRYLATVGWYAVVVGQTRIQQPPGEGKFNYEFVVRFTGGKLKAAK